MTLYLREREYSGIYMMIKGFEVLTYISVEADYFLGNEEEKGMERGLLLWHVCAVCMVWCMVCVGEYCKTPQPHKQRVECER